MKLKKTIGCAACLIISLPALGAWYNGGTLHNATGAQWLAGDFSDQLATSADFVAKMDAASDMSELRVRANSLSSCITEAVSDPSLEQSSVKDVAVLCIVQLGYK